MNAKSIRQLIRDNPRTTDGYPQEVRDTVGRYARQRRADGARWGQIETEIGVSCTSMRKWMQALDSAGFHEVVIVEDDGVVHEEPLGLTITTPSGFSLTGCSLEQAVLLMRGLR